MALAIRTHIIPQLLRNNLIVCLHFLIYKLPTNNNGCVLVGWCDVSECADSGELPPSYTPDRPDTDIGHCRSLADLFFFKVLFI